MPEILRVKINWTGFVGGPGYTNLYFSDFVSEGYTQAIADGAVAKVASFVTSMKPMHPVAVTTGVDPVVDIIQTDTGNLVGYFTTTPPAASACTGAGVYSAASGVCISWGTNGVRNGRRVRGRTFLVPLGGGTYDANGTIGDGNLTAMRGYANTLKDSAGAGDLVVWSRPTGPGATDGVSYPVETATIRDKVAILTSRRD